MPELPEVQTIVNDLNQKIKNDIIVGFWSDWGKSVKGKTIDDFIKEIKNRKILGARRMGKNIFLDLSGGKTLYIHLKMTGHLLIKFSKINTEKKIKISENENKRVSSKDYFSDRVNQYIHHIWSLKSGRKLKFSDLRKFGKIILEDTKKINELKEIKNLGVDALNEKFTLKKFFQILEKKSKAKIGIILMDQTLISGIGNIYRSEILFESKILPEKKAENLTVEEKSKIFFNIKKVLKKAVKFRGTSDSDYRDTSGAPGNFQKVLKVYGRVGKKCKVCDTIIARRKLGQRSVFVCSNCQK